MKHFCKFLMGIVGFALFFLMMIKGWGLELKAVWPLVVYYSWWFFSLLVFMTIEKGEKWKNLKLIGK